MADLPFWKQLLLSGVQGLVAAAGFALAGWAYFRSQERVRREEEVRGELAKVRNAAVVRTLDALGGFLAAKAANEIIADVYSTDSDSDLAAREKHDNAEQDARDAVDSVLAINRFLVPATLHDAIEKCAFSLDNISAYSDEATDALLLLGRSLEPYLPELQRRKVKVTEYPQIARPSPPAPAAPASTAGTDRGPSSP